MRPRPDLRGRTFGRLEVIALAEDAPNGEARWHCRCLCGGAIVTRVTNLQKGKVQSCGCLLREAAARSMRRLIDEGKRWTRDPRRAGAARRAGARQQARPPGWPWKVTA